MRKLAASLSFVALSFLPVCALSQTITKAETTAQTQPANKPQAASTLPATAKRAIVNTATLKIPEGDVKIYYGEKTSYLVDWAPDGYGFPSYWSGASFVVEFMGKKILKNKTLVIDGKSLPVRFWSSNTKVLEFDKDNVPHFGGCFNVKKPGKTMVTIAVRDRRVYIPLEIKKLPLYASMKSSAIIKAIGKPDNRDRSGNDGWRLGVVKDKSIKVPFESWTYNKYPGLRLIVDTGSDWGLNHWRMEAWDAVDDMLFPM